MTQYLNAQWPDMQVANPSRAHPSDPRYKDPSARLAIPYYTESHSPSHSPIKLDIDIDMPAYGIVFMEPPEEARLLALTNHTFPTYHTPLNGHLVVKLPNGIPPARYLGIRIGLRAECKMYPDTKSSGVKPEITLLYEVDRDIPGGILTGEQRFEFSLLIPSTLAPRDWHPRANVINYVYAEIIGTTAPPGLDKPSSPGLLARFNPFSSPKTNATLPVLPEYEESQEDGMTLLVGTHVADRVIRLAYNPNPSGDFNTLDVRCTGVSPDIGAYDIRVFSDVWSISALVRANIALCDIPLLTTIYSVTISVFQITTISPPLPKPGIQPHVSEQKFPLFTSGTTPSRQYEHPDSSHPALWRGTAAGGTDSGVLMLEMQGRVLKDDTVVRPSTLPGVETPIHLAHYLDILIFFTTVGIGADGKGLKNGGNGALRVMRIRRNIMLPNCCIMPKTVALPNYQHPEEWNDRPDASRPWGQCACQLSLEELEQRMDNAIMAEEVAAEQARAASVELRDAARAKGIAM